MSDAAEELREYCEQLAETNPLFALGLALIRNAHEGDWNKVAEDMRERKRYDE